MRVGGQRHAPAALPLGKTWYPLCRRFGGAQDRSGRVLKISPPSGFDPRTVQPLACRYTDWAILAHPLGYVCTKIKKTGKNINIAYALLVRAHGFFFFLTICSSIWMFSKELEQLWPLRLQGFLVSVRWNVEYCCIVWHGNLTLITTKV
jgi:hypothetical protein